jgi:hypothetical protein
MDGICKLCLNSAELEKSHVLPKFIYRWITRTSATGRLRGLGKPNVAHQDGLKMPLLCSDCEDRFNKYETWFANNFFHPSINAIKINYNYTEALYKFAISLFWRTIIVNLDRDIYNETPLKSKLIACEKELREFLLSDKYPNNFDKIYIGITSYVANAPPHLKGINHYFTRSTDHQIIFDDSNKKMFFYCIIPYFFFIGNITGLSSDDFENCQINPIGGHFLTTSIKIKEPNVTNAIQEQLLRINELVLSDNQQQILDDMIIKNIDKYLNSKSFEATFLDKIRED